MPKITIDNKEYDTDTLSEQVKAELNMLVATDQEIARLNAQLAIAQTARVAYSRAINEGLSGNTDTKTTVN